jgi:hypothetical protein
MIERRLALLLAAATVLAAYALWSGDNPLLAQWGLGPASPAADGATARKPEDAQGEPTLKPVVNPLGGLELESFTETIERPLFDPARARPVPVVAEEEPVEETPPPAVEEPKSPEDFTLLAVASREGAWTALVRWESEGKVYHLKKGDTLSDWQLTDVSPRDATLSQEGRVLQLKLFEKRASAPPIAGAEMMVPDPDDIGAPSPVRPGSMEGENGDE